MTAGGCKRRGVWVQVDDEVEFVDGVDCSGLNVTAVRELLWGERGSSVEVAVVRRVRRDVQRVTAVLRRGERLTCADGQWEWVHPSVSIAEASHPAWSATALPPTGPMPRAPPGPPRLHRIV